MFLYNPVLITWAPFLLPQQIFPGLFTRGTKVLLLIVFAFLAWAMGWQVVSVAAQSQVEVKQSLQISVLIGHFYCQYNQIHSCCHNHEIVWSAGLCVFVGCDAVFIQLLDEA